MKNKGKKEHERRILDQFIGFSKLGLDVLSPDSARQFYPEYDGEKPDFIAVFEGKKIGIELFELCLKDSPRKYGGKNYKNPMHKRNDFPDHIRTKGQFKKYRRCLRDVHSSPDQFEEKEQDNLTDILQEKLEKKSKSMSLYVTSDIWLLAHTTIGDHAGMVADIFDDGVEERMKEVVKKLITENHRMTGRVKRVILFEPDSETEPCLSVDIT